MITEEVHPKKDREGEKGPIIDDRHPDCAPFDFTAQREYFARMREGNEETLTCAMHNE